MEGVLRYVPGLIDRFKTCRSNEVLVSARLTEDLARFSY